MGKVTILPQTTKEPITLIGTCAGVCYGTDTYDHEKTYKRGLDCIKSNHGRTLEYPDVYAVLDGYSARVIREWYTHIGGAPTRLQASTRYIDYSDFKYVIPSSIENNEKALAYYNGVMKTIDVVAAALILEGIPREDVANILPLGMETRIVDKRNLRNIIDMSHTRLCTRAYHEYRTMFIEYLNALASYSEEWKTIVDMTMRPKCDVIGHCQEKNSCGRRSKGE